MSPTVLTTFPGVLPRHSEGRGCSRQCVDPSGGHQDKNSIIERSLLALIYQRFLLGIIFLLLGLESLATDCLALLPPSLCHGMAGLRGSCMLLLNHHVLQRWVSYNEPGCGGTQPMVLIFFNFVA